MSVQKVGEIFLWKTSNFLSGAFLLPFSIFHVKVLRPTFSELSFKTKNEVKVLAVLLCYKTDN